MVKLQGMAKMIQKIKSHGPDLKHHWNRLSPYHQIAVVLFLVMVMLSSIKFIEREVWGVLGARLVHFGTYFVLGLLVYKGFQAPFLQRCIFAFGVIAGLSLVDELLQVLVPHASPSLEDWITDVAGGIIAIGLFAVAQLVRDTYRTWRQERLEDAS